MRISDWSSDVCSSDLVYLVFNTIGNVETQDRQVACFANAAAHLEPGGAFVIELVVPDLRRLVPGHDAVVFAHGPGYVGYDRYDDVVAQHAVSHHRSEEHTSELQSLMRISYAVFCLKKKKQQQAI